jgi:hypothetical protein
MAARPYHREALRVGGRQPIVQCACQSCDSTTRNAHHEGSHPILQSDPIEPRAQFRLVPPPERLSDTKWPSSELLHHSPPCFSFLSFLSPRFLRRVAPRRYISGYAFRASEFRQYSHWLLFDLMHCVQTYNSLAQSPCTVLANLMATCDAGSEFFQLFVSGPCGLISLQSTQSRR